MLQVPSFLHSFLYVLHTDNKLFFHLQKYPKICAVQNKYVISNCHTFNRFFMNPLFLKCKMPGFSHDKFVIQSMLHVIIATHLSCVNSQKNKTLETL